MGIIITYNSSGFPISGRQWKSKTISFGTLTHSIQNNLHAQQPKTQSSEAKWKKQKTKYYYLMWIISYIIFFLISVVLSFNYCVLSTLLEHSCKHILWTEQEGQENRVLSVSHQALKWTRGWNVGLAPEPPATHTAAHQLIWWSSVCLSPVHRTRLSGEMPPKEPQLTGLRALAAAKWDSR